MPQEGDANTAFREAEKKYQLHYDQILRRRNGRPRGVGFKVRETDFSQVLDFSSPTACQSGVSAIETPAGKAYVVEDKPGFCFISEALSPAEQWRLIVDCLTRLTEPPATTNHTKQHGPIPGLWRAAQQDLRLHKSEADCWVAGSEGLAAKALLSKLRWASVGPNFDWTQRKYLYDKPHQPLPVHLKQIAQRCAEAACQGEGRSYEPDAALVNYYSPGDTLGGHRDDVEADLTQPIVSISLGCDGIFLLGGFSRDVEPLPMLLRSGDVVVLAGEARQCFHGVPRILEGSRLPDPGPGAPGAAAEDLRDFQAHMYGRRINISVRTTL